MHKYYESYYWDHGIPRGKGLLSEEKGSFRHSFKIVSDPYHKRISIEQYEGERFLKIVYDSVLFDFRWLKPEAQIAWSKETLEETSDEVICLIRNQDDRVILREHYVFKEGLCHYCRASHPSGQHISLQQMYYKAFGDAFNGVVLFDQLSHPVVFKEYEVDECTGEFSSLLRDVWKTDDLNRFNIPINSRLLA